MKIATINNEFVPTLIDILWDEKTGAISSHGRQSRAYSAGWLRWANI